MHRHREHIHKDTNKTAAHQSNPLARPHAAPPLYAVYTLLLTLLLCTALTAVYYVSPYIPIHAYQQRLLTVTHESLPFHVRASSTPAHPCSSPHSLRMTLPC